VAPGVDGAAALQIGGLDPAYSIVDVDMSISGAYGAMSQSGAGGPSGSASGLVYSSYTAMPSSSASGGAQPSKVTKVFTDVDGTTILEISEPTDRPHGGYGGSGYGGHRKGNCKGGQWLHGVPYLQQNRKVNCGAGCWFSAELIQTERPPIRQSWIDRSFYSQSQTPWPTLNMYPTSRFGRAKSCIALINATRR